LIEEVAERQALVGRELPLLDLAGCGYEFLSDVLAGFT